MAFCTAPETVKRPRGLGWDYAGRHRMHGSCARLPTVAATKG
jgi:hypothetical protein